MEHQPERHEDVEGCGLGVTAWPLEDRLQVGCVVNLLGSSVMEGCVVNDAYGFARHLVAQCEEMRKVILTESGVVFLQFAYSLLFLRGILTGKALGVGDRLYLPAMLLPLLLYFLNSLIVDIAFSL